MRKLCNLVVALVWGWVGAFQAPVHYSQPTCQLNRGGMELAMSTSAIDGSATTFHSILKKPSKVLTVGLEYAGGNKLSPVELSILSMQLRKSKVSAIWTTDLQVIQHFSTEQQSARGNFPGPCPVIYFGPTGEAEQALNFGASALVLSVDDLVDTLPIPGEIIWKVKSANDVETILTKMDGHANVFWVDGDSSDEDVAAKIEALPSKALWIAAVNAMQPDGAEIAQGKEYKTRGCGSILIRNACIGDSEDTEYAQFCVGGFTSKASSEFKFSGLTGSTNGHFGGIQASSSVKWKRLNA